MTMVAKFIPASIENGVVEVWIVDLVNSDDTLARDYQLLSSDERQRAEQFRFPAHRARFVTARASLRKILSQYLEAEPSQLAFKYSGYGKPELAMPQTDLCFNASRSHEHALVACTRALAIGADIEWIRRDLDIDDLARCFFTAPEAEKIQAFSPDLRHRAFLRCWTCKEAFIKADGKGLSANLNQFDVSIALGNPTAPPPTRDETFRLADCFLTAFAPRAGYLSALVVRGIEAQILVKYWAEEEAFPGPV
jgi:4'-phosphopantetheinyl transferase